MQHLAHAQSYKRHGRQPPLSVEEWGVAVRLAVEVLYFFFLQFLSFDFRLLFVVEFRQSACMLRDISIMSQVFENLCL